uniref:PTS fructose-like transporter subunit IIB n=1 Tax=Halomonas sp. TaxID=1486246 RepID=UPI00260DC40D|nr:PTS fructose-like transporter subunit IIB [Halomonas sp.]
MNVILISTCPNGTATSYLAVERLKPAAEALNWHIDVELHSSLAKVEPLSASAIKDAELVIAVGEQIPDAGRFAGKRLYRASLQEVLPEPEAFLQRASREAEVFTGDAFSGDASPAVAKGSQDTDSKLNIVAVTACPTGVAHTFMAAEALAEAGRSLGHKVRVETQGSVGAQDQLSDAEITAADLVILACDIEVNADRFAGKRIYRTSTGNALKKSRQTIEAAAAEAQVEDAGATDQAGGRSEAAKSFKEKGVYKHLLTGVSFMLPMVVAGGLLIALSFVFGIKAFEEEGTLAAALMQIGGGTAFKLMVPVLAGYIAYSIADRPGIAPGMIGGLLAADLGAGFIGGILAGFLAGYTAKAIVRYVKLPPSVESLKPILIIPLLASLVTGLVMIYIVGTPVAGILSTLTAFLKSMGSTNAVLLGALLGAMMCFDLGGPVNKAAYTFGVGLLASETYAPMAAIMAAGMVPAIGMGIATFVARSKFAVAEREAGKASFVLGLCFITEGAIPFAAKDPLRVIPASMLGGALTGALSMLFGAQLMAPHGGIFVLLIPHAITPVVWYLLAIVAGSVVTGLGYAALKRSEAAPMAVTVNS